MSDASDHIALAGKAGRAFRTRFDAVLALVADSGVVVVVDGRCDPPAITMDDNGLTPDCTLLGADDTLERVLAGERGLENAFVSGRLALSGDMSVMSRLEIAGRSRHDV